MTRIALIAAGLSLLVFGVWRYTEWHRADAVKDFVLEATIAQAEADAENQEDLERITNEIENSTVDELRARAAAGGMFRDEPTPTD